MRPLELGQTIRYSCRRISAAGCMGYRFSCANADTVHDRYRMTSAAGLEASMAMSWTDTARGHVRPFHSPRLEYELGNFLRSLSQHDMELSVTCSTTWYGRHQ